MEIRIRETGEIVSEREFRRLHSKTSFPALTPDLLDAYGADPVLNGPDAQNLLWWQHSQRDGVEQINGKWYTKHIAGPVFSTDEDRDIYIAQREADAIPVSVSMKSARKALILAGIPMATINAAFDAIPDATQKELAKIDWEFSSVVRLDSPLVVSMAGALGLTDAEVDGLFVAASQIPD
jgi:hypothetical protein